MTSYSRTALAIDIILCLLIIVSFFRPWIQLEMVPLKGIHLNEITIENYGAEHFMAKIIYAVYGLAVLAILVISASLFQFTRFMVPVKVVMLLIAAATFWIILRFHISDEYNISMREGMVVSALCSLSLVMREVISRFVVRSS